MALAIAIRPAEPSDAELVAGWLNQPEINRHLTSNLRFGGMTPGLIRAALRRPDQMWFLYCDRAGAPLGLIALDSLDRIDGVANLWYLLGEQRLARRGISSAALAQLLADNPMELTTVTAWVAEPNAASLGCLRRAGFREIGRVSRGVALDGARYDRILFERLLDPA